MHKAKDYYTMADVAQMACISRPLLSILVNVARVLPAPTHAVGKQRKRYYTAEEVLAIASTIKREGYAHRR